MYKKFAPIILVVVLAALAIAATFWRGQNQPALPVESPVADAQNQATQPSSDLDTAPVSTADWKMYRNEKYEFEVKYPSERIIMNQIGNCGICDFDVAFLTQEEYNAVNYSEATPFPQNSIYIFIFKLKFTHDSLLEWYKENYGYQPLKYEYFKINTIEGIKEITPGAYTDSEFRSAYFLNNRTIYSIRAASTNELDRVLSTFKFLK